MGNWIHGLSDWWMDRRTDNIHKVQWQYNNGTCLHWVSHGHDYFFASCCSCISWCWWWLSHVYQPVVSLAYTGLRSTIGTAQRAISANVMDGICDKLADINSITGIILHYLPSHGLTSPTCLHMKRRLRLMPRFLPVCIVSQRGRNFTTRKTCWEFLCLWTVQTLYRRRFVGASSRMQQRWWREEEGEEAAVFLGPIWTDGWLKLDRVVFL